MHNTNSHTGPILGGLTISESAYTNNPIFEKVVELYLGKPYNELAEAEREEKGIIVMKPPEKITVGSNKKLYEIEMDAVMELLKAHREKHFPELVPVKSSIAHTLRDDRHARQ